MAAPAWAELRLALTGALLLARGNPKGLAGFDASLDGFWRSFRAAALCYPLYLILLSFPVGASPAVSLDDWGGVAVETVHYVISWVAFPLLVLPLADWLRRGNRFFAFMVAYNWCQVPLTALFALVALAGASGALSADAAEIADLAVAVAAMVYEWYIARVALAIGGPQAALVVALDVALATALTQISTALYSG